MSARPYRHESDDRNGIERVVMVHEGLRCWRCRTEAAPVVVAWERDGEYYFPAEVLIGADECTVCGESLATRIEDDDMALHAEVERRYADAMVDGD